MLDHESQKFYNIWLNSPRVSAEMKTMLTLMGSEEIKSSFDQTPLKFGTAGVRMKMGVGFQRFNTFTYQMLTEGLAKHLLNKYSNDSVISVVIGHDNRKDSSHFALICARVLSSFGIKAILFEDNELMPTPVISYTVQKYKAHAGINITASHNPKIYNGFKIYGKNGAQILDDDANDIIANCPKFGDILDNIYQLQKSNIAYISRDNLNDYFKDAKNSLVNTFPSVNKTFPIVFTGHHGTSCKKMPRFLKMLGYSNVISVTEQNQYDSDFRNSPIVNPEDPASFALSLEYAKKHNANIIIACDPDADRMGCAIKHNDEWKYLSGNEMGIIFTYYILKTRVFTKQPYIVSSYVSNNLIDLIAKKYDAVVYRTPTGFKWMGNLVSDIGKEKSFVVAFEEAVGALTSDICHDKDGFQAGALALEIYDMLLKQNRDFVDYLDEIFKEYGYWQGLTYSIHITFKNWKEKAQEMLDQVLKFQKTTLFHREITSISFNEKGGCVDWIMNNNSWIRFRMSGTEPKFKIYYNLFGSNLQELNQEINQWNEWFKEFFKF